MIVLLNQTSMYPISVSHSLSFFKRDERVAVRTGEINQPCYCMVYGTIGKQRGKSGGALDSCAVGRWSSAAE